MRTMKATKQLALMLAASVLLVGSVARAGETARSSDGSYSVSIVPNGEGDENGSGAQALVLYNTNNNVQRKLLVSKWNGDYRRNLAGLSNPMFSLDNGFVYFNSADASPNSAYVHQLDLKLNAIRSICSGSAIRVMRTGAYRGYLLVQTHRYWDRPEGGSYNPVFLTHPSGKKIMMIPGSDIDDGELAVDPWLTKMKWRAW